MRNVKIRGRANAENFYLKTICQISLSSSHVRRLLADQSSLTSRDMLTLRPRAPDTRRRARAADVAGRGL
ncbi:hypothetical protein E2C01_021481 [Portunus trituberculatus]|uniref:Uncharacterized protein n=1 Tax=Portunus trituberculatus TaxID=210409 RepID=A0A5B7E2T9_PORTR|nr:hypothetical protein [Portunus trituberculatus]